MKRASVVLVAALFLAACGGSPAPTPDLVATQSAQAQALAAALTASAPTSTHTPQPTPTPTPTATATSTATPTPKPPDTPTLTPSPSATPAPPDMTPASWVTYTHPSGFFAVSYPGNWPVRQEDDHSVAFTAADHARFGVAFGAYECAVGKGADLTKAALCIAGRLAASPMAEDFRLVTAGVWDDGVHQGAVVEYTLSMWSQTVFTYYVWVSIPAPDDEQAFMISYYRTNTRTITGEERQLLRQVLSSIH